MCINDSRWKPDVFPRLSGRLLGAFVIVECDVRRVTMAKSSIMSMTDKVETGSWKFFVLGSEDLTPVKGMPYFHNS